MDFPITTYDHEIFIEYRISEHVTLDCIGKAQGLRQKVSYPLAQKFAHALQEFVEIPENVQRFKTTYPEIKNMIDPGKTIYFEPEENLVFFGFWRLECPEPNAFRWAIRTLRPMRMSIMATLKYIDTDKSWIVEELEIMRIWPKR